MGITAISIGFGALFPSLNRISKPFVCPSGRMDLVTQDYHPSPIETVTTLTWYCVNEETGTQTEIGIFPMALSAGTIYGLLLFIVVFIGMVLFTRRSSTVVERASPFRDTAALHSSGMSNPMGKSPASSGALKRMKELQELREANLISETEYEQKRSEILKGL